jgi:GLPGLI family protein
MVGQSKHLEIEYQLNLKLIDDSKESSDFMNRIINNLKQYEDRLKFILQVDNEYSKFYGKKFLESDMNPQLSSQLKLHSDFSKVYYQSKKEEVFIINFISNAFSGTVIKDKIIDLDWKIRQSGRKVILGYECYMAETTLEIGRDKYSIKAWFTPAINFKLGPKNLNGLPGLILAFEQNAQQYYEAIKITQLKNKDIIIPEFESTQTYDEFTNAIIEKYNFADY